MRNQIKQPLMAAMSAAVYVDFCFTYFLRFFGFGFVGSSFHISASVMQTEEKVYVRVKFTASKPPWPDPLS
jgi:hypothetical protein